LSCQTTRLSRVSSKAWRLARRDGRRAGPIADDGVAVRQPLQAGGETELDLPGISCCVTSQTNAALRVDFDTR